MNQSDIQSLTALHALMKSDPQKAREKLLSNPAILQGLQDLDRRYTAARDVSVDGFAMFYKEIYLRPLPLVAYPIIALFVWAYKNKKGVLEECWRGFGKSTLLLAWVAYVTGVRPVGSSVFIRINEKSAQKSGSTIAEIIETNPGWKEIFPHVVPDKDAGWSSENGYHVKDTEYIAANSYEKWLQLCFADHVSEPSIACGGVTSGIVIGTHPTNGCWIDDLHDEGNTRSLAEMEEVVSMLKGNIIQTWFGTGGSPAIGVACTPWNDHDAYAEMLRTGLFKKISIPIFVKEGQIPEGHPCTKIWEDNLNQYGVSWFEPYECNVILTMPVQYTIEKVTDIYYSNPTRFGQMYLLDLASLKGITLRKEVLGMYPVEKIDPNWPCFFGVDFASTTDKLKKDTDFFALAIGRLIPGGGMVVENGFVARLSMDEAMNKMNALYQVYRPIIIGVEKLGAGRQFIETLVLNTRLPILPLPHKGTPLKSKGAKFEEVLNSLFSQGRLWLSSASNELIQTFIDQWVTWDGSMDKGAGGSRTGHDDVLDAVYLLTLAAQGHIMQAPPPGVEPFRKKTQPSPWSSLGKRGIT